ncbi:BrnA antitoxin family protein [Patescibacteria group bacterium]|nr:BrnA antitoxin family protein [Patescibacteria group bacterium]MBU4017280.1 BrnA antitoxin family protein [Patescibacteria group bacterium]MBU4099559.1 BrnA antitoxin family protein [Patescibacteria group bacterium]
MNQIKNKIPKFKNEDEEREFWATHDTTDYLDNFEPIDLQFPSLKPTTKTISIRLPESMINQLKRLANKRDVPYQSLLKILLGEKLKEESISL